MLRRSFADLKLRLLSAGITPVCVERTVLELAEHCEDLECAARASGLEPQAAAEWADRALGSDEAILEAALARPELGVWSRRWPRISLLLRSVAVIGLAPLAPLAFCVERGAVLARWGVSTALAALVTSALLLSLNWLIVL